MQLLNEICTKIPYSKEDKFIYIESFVGSGAVLFWVLNNYKNVKNVIINDINTDLINTYNVIKNSVVELIAVLGGLESEYHALSDSQEKKKEYYYSKRVVFNNRSAQQINQAALFIFLNKTCFNGLYRVNKKNEFNVPISSYKRPTICDTWNLMAVSKVLANVEIINKDFEKTMAFSGNDAFYYLDPPYKPLSETSSFNLYAKDGYDDNEQVRLKKFCDRLDTLGAKWALSNSDAKGDKPNEHFFDNLYGKYEIMRVLAKRSINSNASKRGKITELLITNYSRQINVVW